MIRPLSRIRERGSVSFLNLPLSSWDSIDLMDVCEMTPDLCLVEYDLYRGNCTIIHGNHFCIFFEPKVLIWKLKEERHYIERGEILDPIEPVSGNAVYLNSILLNEGGRYRSISESMLRHPLRPEFSSIKFNGATCFDGVFWRSSPCNYGGDKTEVLAVTNASFFKSLARAAASIPQVAQSQGCPNLWEWGTNWSRYGDEMARHMFDQKAAFELEARRRAQQAAEASAKLNRIRNKTLKVKPLEFLAMTQTIKTYATQNH